MLRILHETDEIVVVDKPAGLATQPGAGISLSLVEVVERDLGFRPFLVHRLDRETAGCIIVARSSRAASRWTELIATREVGKTYRAIVAGIPEADRGGLDTPVRVRGEMKSARSSYLVIKTFHGAAGGPGSRGEAGGGPSSGETAAPLSVSLLELELGTGRTHQLRQQLAEAGHPILGDDAHGDFGLNRKLKKSLGLKRLMLHAARLRLPGGIAADSPTPEHFQAILDALAALEVSAADPRVAGRQGPQDGERP